MQTPNLHLPRPRLGAVASALSLSLALSLAAGPAAAADAAAKPASSKPAAAKPPAGKTGKPATPRQQLKSEAGGLALATVTAETINQAQLDVAARVLTGDAACEFNQRISVQPVADLPGHFHIGFKGQRYTMVPEETSTGAVRLFDRRAGVVWLQIPTKSMLMNAKIGQRMVDACQHAEQRIAVNAATDAAAGLGIVPGSPQATPGSVGASATATPPAPMSPPGAGAAASSPR